MSLRVNLTDAAIGDVRNILHWIQQRSEAGARSWFETWQGVVDALAERADSFGLAPESEDHDEPIRQATFKTRRGRPYRALFVVRSGEVFVLHVRGPGQQLLRRDELT